MDNVTIATHSGLFHADDVFAVAALLLVFPGAKVVRSRNPKEIEGAGFVIDVGGVYDHARQRYDHHQRERAGARANGVLYSSFGLIWKHYGAVVVGALGVEEAHRSEVASIVDTTLVAPIDATDNGQNLFEGGRPVFEDVRTVTLSAVVSSFNPAWHEQGKDFDAAFATSVEFAKGQLRRAVQYALGTVLAKEEVRKGLSESGDSPALVLARFVPWQDEVEGTDKKFVVFPSDSGGWMLQGVRKTPSSFEIRHPLPEAWAGKKDEELRALTGVSDATFCHPGRFIAGAASKEGALKLLELALKGDVFDVPVPWGKPGEAGLQVWQGASAWLQKYGGEEAGVGYEGNRPGVLFVSPVGFDIRAGANYRLDEHGLIRFDVSEQNGSVVLRNKENGRVVFVRVSLTKGLRMTLAEE